MKTIVNFCGALALIVFGIALMHPVAGFWRKSIGVRLILLAGKWINFDLDRSRYDS